MARLRMVAVLLGVLVCYLTVTSAQEADTKPEDVLAENSEVEGSDDLETAESKKILFFLAKKKLAEIFLLKKKLGLDFFPSYRQYYPVTYQNYGYQNTNDYGYQNNDKFSKYMKSILDCFQSGQGYAPSSGYTGSSYGGSSYGGSSYGGSSYGGNSYGSGSSSGGSYPTKSYFFGGKPAYSSSGSGNGYFGGSISGSASFSGSTGSAAAGSGGFVPSYPSYSTYDTPATFGSSGQSYYSSVTYPGYKSPTPSYYYADTAPQVQPPQYVQSTVPIQPLNSPPSFAISILVPPGSESSIGNPQSPTSKPIPIPSQRGEDSVPLTSRPVPAGNPLVYSTYSSDYYLTRPYYSPGFAYPSGQNPPQVSYSYNGYYVPSYPSAGNTGFSSTYNGQGYSGAGNGYQFAVYPGTGTVGATGQPVVAPASGVVFPTTAAPVTPVKDC